MDRALIFMYLFVWYNANFHIFPKLLPKKSMLLTVAMEGSHLSLFRAFCQWVKCCAELHLWVNKALQNLNLRQFVLENDADG